MLVMMATEDCLQRGAIMDIAKRFNMAYSTIHRLWFCFVSTLPNMAYNCARWWDYSSMAWQPSIKASENICIIADRCDFLIPKIFPCWVKVFMDETDDTTELK